MNFFPCHLRIEAGKTFLHCPWFQLAIDEKRVTGGVVSGEWVGQTLLSGARQECLAHPAHSPLTTHDSLPLKETTHHSPNEILLGVRPYDLHVVEPSQADAIVRVETVERLGHQ